MKGKFIVCLLIGSLILGLSLAATEKSKTEKVKPKINEENTLTASLPKTTSEKRTNENVDKRQVDHQTSINPQDQLDSAFRSANHFVVRAVGYNNRIGSRRVHANNDDSNNVHQQFISQPSARKQHQVEQQQTPEDSIQQQYGFYHEFQQPTHRFQQYRPLAESFKPLLKSSYHPRLAQYVPQAQQLIQPQQHIQSEQSQGQADIPQYAPHPYPIVQEDQLLKLLENELANKEITASPQQSQHVQQSVLLQKRPHQSAQHQSLQIHHSQQQQQQHHPRSQAHTQKSEIKYKTAGLGNFKQAASSHPDNMHYVYYSQQQLDPQSHSQQQQQQQLQQHQQQHPQQHHHQQLLQQNSLPQELVETPPPPQYFIQHQEPAPITYQAKISNSQSIQQSNFEKEYEKLFPVNKHHNDNEPQYALVQPQSQAYKTSHKLHTKPQLISEKEYSFLPSLAQFSGFTHQTKSSKAQPEKLQSSRQYLPKVNYNHGQYLVETKMSAKQSKVKNSVSNPSLIHSPSLNNLQLINPKPQSTSIQYYTTNSQKSAKSQQNQFIPIVHNTPVSINKKENAMKIIDAPALQYEKPEQQQLYYKGPIAEHSEQIVTPAAPASVSTIFVSQATGIEPIPRPHKQTHNFNTQLSKTYKDDKRAELKLPPPDGKPITQEEFQALVDAGYPVQAVPIPVPVPYEEYIKTHPSYKQEQERKISENEREQEQDQQENQRQQQNAQFQAQQQQQDAVETNRYNTQDNGVTYLRQIPQRHHRYHSQITENQNKN